MTTEAEQPPVADVSTMLAEFAASAANADPENRQPMAAGTFAVYPMPDGGLMFVTLVADGPMAGEHHHRFPPALIRAALALAGGGGKLSALKGLMGVGRKG